MSYKGFWKRLINVKIDAADREFSRFIRTRDEWTCQKCGKFYPEGRRQGLHCSHIFSRRHQATRFYSGNAKALCFSCHQWYGGNPLESAAWIDTYLGSDAVEELTRRKNSIKKRTKAEKKEIAAHWRAQTKYLERCREEGKDYQVMEWD